MLRSSRGSILSAVLICLAAGLVSGCASPLVVYRPLSEAMAQEDGRPLELQLTTGERYIIRDGRVRHDTLFAVRVQSPTADSSLVVPVTRIASLRRTERSMSASGAGTVGLVSGVLLGALVIVLLVAETYARGG